MTKIKITFETEPCSRCGGSGQFSFCTRFGETCFKCGGNKTQFTASAKRILARYRKNLPDLNVLVTELKKGDKIVDCGRNLTFKEFVESGSCSVAEDGTRTKHIGVSYENSKMVYSYFPSQELRVRPTPQQMKDAIDKASKRSSLGLVGVECN